jgi:hypothetical protein
MHVFVIQRDLGSFDFTPCHAIASRGGGSSSNATAQVAVSPAAGTDFTRTSSNCAALLGEVALRLTEHSHRVGSDGAAWTPFADGAKKAGEAWEGGKMDDVVVVLGFVVEGK